MFSLLIIEIFFLYFPAIKYILLLKCKILIAFFFSIVVIIESVRGLPPINEESVIFKEDREAAGKVCV